ncbi:hypothetical protein NVP1081O_238 [Vibrio phage 1.081.O._10N.286.52.C2]|nr:hypothetical protein NVP1081O_238 [Vibrio phage 1.081.O._10N.286.52.C2]
MKKLILLAAMIALPFASLAMDRHGPGHGGGDDNRVWKSEGDNHFVTTQKGVCGIRVIDDTADLAVSLTDTPTITDYTDNDVLNNKSDYTVIDMEYDFDDSEGLFEAAQVQLEVIVDGRTELLPVGATTYTMTMDKNLQSFAVGMRVLNGTLLEQGDHKVTITYDIECE